MARFYLSARNDGKSNATEVHRLAHTVGHTTTASWSGAVRVEAYEFRAGSSDRVRISFEPWKGRGEAAILYDGMFGGHDLCAGLTTHVYQAIASNPEVMAMLNAMADDIKSAEG